MKSFTRICALRSILLVLLLVFSTELVAQITFVNIKATKVFSTATSDGESNYDYRFNTWFGGTYNSNCIGLENVANYVEHDVLAHDQQRVSNSYFSSMATAKDLEVEAWEEDGCGGDCGYNTSCGGSDEEQCGRHVARSIVPYDYIPGNYLGSPNLFTHSMCGGKYTITFLVSYNPPAPASPTVKFKKQSDGAYSDYIGGQICDEVSLELRATLNINPSYYSHVNYTWQYWDGVSYIDVPNPAYCEGPGMCEPFPPGPDEIESPIFTPQPCCDEPPTIPEPHWRTIAGTSNAGTDGGRKEIPNIRALEGLTNITTQTTIYFRAVATANGLTSGFGNAIAVYLSPAAPVIGSITTESSCTEKPTGVIHVTGISGLGTYRYVLRNGADSAPCNDACLSGSSGGPFTDTKLDITTDVNDQQYTLLITNTGGLSGVCYDYRTFTVASKPNLNIPTFSDTDIARHDYDEGSIGFTTANGDVGVRTYTLNNLTTGSTAFTPVVASNVAYSSLPIGNYQLTVQDGNCSPPATRTFAITRPRKVTKVSFTDAEATCNLPGNGVIDFSYAKTSGLFDIQPPDTEEFNNRLVKGGVEWANWNTTATSWSRSDLPPGDYVLYVKESGGSDLNAYVETFTISPPPELGITGSPTATPVKCNSGNDGIITFTPKGGSGAYSYELNKDATTLTSATASFSSLYAGDYYLTVKNTTAGCADKYPHPTVITVGQPSAIGFTMSKTDLTCFESGNGTASAVVLGGTPKVVPSAPYTYSWQIKDGASWASYPGTGVTINNLNAGEYRITATDANICLASSAPIIVTQPDPLTITSVTVEQHVVCYGDKGTFAVVSTGGTPGSGYNQYYSTDGGDTFHPLVPLEAGSYLIKTVDANGCEFPDPDYHTLTSPDAPLDFSTEIPLRNGYTNACNGDSSGEITLTATGGNDYGYTGYTYKKNAGAFGTSEHLDNIMAGSNSFTVQDGRGCQVTKNISFTQPDMLAPFLTEKIDVECFGMATGKLEVSVSGGVGDKNYQLGAGTPQATGLFENLVANTYSVTIRDENSCEAIFIQPIVNLNPALEIENTIKDVSCFEGADGAITVSVTGGVAPYEFKREDLVISNPLTDLVTGNYQIIITDQEGCSIETESLLVRQPAKLVIADVQLNDIRCFGETGTIGILSEGGVAPYVLEYSLDNGATFSNFEADTPLDAGAYVVRTIDANSCITQHEDVFTITAPPAALDFTHVLSNYSGFNISCKGKDDGHITLTASGGNGATYTSYTYTVDARPFGIENALTGILAGDHVIAVKDARGCVEEKTILFTEAASIVATLAEKKDVVCFGAFTGEIKVAGAGGAGAYLYSVGTSDFKDSPVFPGLEAGEYVVTAKDENGCSASFTQTIININTAIDIELEKVIDASCYTYKDGAIELNITGGVSPYQYKVGSQYVPNPVPDLLAGTYTITVVDAEGCEVESTAITVAEPEDLIVTNVTTHDIRCLGESGTVEMEASGGTAPYSFEFDLLSTSDSYAAFTPSTPLAAGNYNLRARDNHGCASVASNTTITQPAVALDFSYVLSNYNGYNISCFGGYNGYATLTAKGGNGASYTGYEYRLDDQPYQAMDRLVDIDAGFHTLAVTDARGCIVEKSVSFTQSDDEIHAVIARIKDVPCVEDRKGEIEVQAEGGVSPYQYRFVSGSPQSSSTFTELGVGDYEIIVADVNNCAVHVPARIVNTVPAMELTHSVVNVSCFAGQDGKVKINVASGGAVPFQYNWAGMPATTDEVRGLRTGTYTVTVTDQAGCKKTADITVTQPIAPLEINVSPIAACYGKSDGVVSIEPRGGTAPYQYSTNNGSSYQNSSQFNVPVGTYQVKVEDAKGCFTTTTTTVQQRNIRPEPNFIVATRRNALDTLVLSEISVPKPDSIFWQFDSRTIVISNDPWAPEIKFPEEGSYTVNMEGFFGGCGYVITKTLTINPYDPNAIIEKKPNYKAIESVSVVPNPNTGQFNMEVKLNRTYNASVIIYDITGVIRFQNKWEEVTGITESVNLGEVPSGVYLLRVITDAGAEEVRIIVSR